MAGRGRGMVMPAWMKQRIESGDLGPPQQDPAKAEPSPYEREGKGNLAISSVDRGLRILSLDIEGEWDLRLRRLKPAMTDMIRIMTAMEIAGDRTTAIVTGTAIASATERSGSATASAIATGTETGTRTETRIETRTAIAGRDTTRATAIGAATTIAAAIGTVARAEATAGMGTTEADDPGIGGTIGGGYRVRGALEALAWQSNEATGETAIGWIGVRGFAAGLRMTTR
eukprot:scaffold1166_cov261-Pinguiococcus_pyrenoidosus.AAC.3